MRNARPFEFIFYIVVQSECTIHLVIHCQSTEDEVGWYITSVVTVRLGRQLDESLYFWYHVQYSTRKNVLKGDTAPEAVCLPGTRGAKHSRGSWGSIQFPFS